MRYQRLQQVIDYIKQNRTVSLDEICSRFDISKSTLRRDLGIILQDNNFKKTYGGIEFQPPKKLLSFEERNISNRAGKQEIALLAADQVEDHDVIFVDSGTTTLHMVKGLKEKKDLVVLTNNLEFIIQALPDENITLISLPGTLDRETLSFTGTDVAEMLQHYNISKAFMATTGFSAVHGITNFSPAEAHVKRTVINRSQQVFLLADSSKFGAASLMTYCNLDDIDVLITNRQPPSDLSRSLEMSGVKTMVTKIEESFLRLVAPAFSGQ